MNAKHTPGPWKVEERTKRGTYGQPVKGCATSISVSANTVLFHCAVIADGSNLETAKANAALIAAAPEMFEALVSICAVLAIREDLCDDSKFLSDARNRALASLAKARGEKEVTE